MNQQYIISNKENQVNRPTNIDGRTPLSTIKGNSNPLKPITVTYDQVKQHKSSSSSSSSSSTSALQSRVLIAKQEHSLENALKKIKELEAQLKEKDQVIADLTTKNQILVESLGENENTNSRINNNRIRKIQQLTLSNKTLQEKLDESLYKNEKNDKVNIMQNNHRIRLIQKLKLENVDLKQQQQQQIQNSHQSNHHHHSHHHHQHTEHQHQQNVEQLSSININNRTTISSEPAQSTKELLIAQTQLSTFSSNYYGLEDYEQHVGEC